MSIGPLISILIPTRARVETLKYAIESALDQDFSDYEIVVSDNCSGDGTREMVKSFASRGVRYVSTRSRVTMCDNFENAFDASTGRYVIIIGDDDAIVPGALSRIANLLRLRHARVVTWPYAKYYWPMAGRNARSSPLPSSVERLVNLARIARMSARLGGAMFSRLVSPYHSCVERGVLEHVKEKVGRVFATTMPDIFLHYAIPPISPTAVRASFIGTVGGVSARSNSGSFHLEKRHPNFEADERREYAIHRTLHPGWSSSALSLVDCMLVAVDAFPDFYTQPTATNEAILAYLCTKPIGGDMSIGGIGVFRQREDIRLRASLSLSKFAAWWSVHQVLRARLKIIRGRDDMDRSDAPADVHEFARTVAALQGFNRALSG